MGDDFTLVTDFSNAQPLDRLARAWGVMVSYQDVAGVERNASERALVGVLKALGAPVERPADAPSALREHLLNQWRRLLDPIVVAWEGGGTFDLRVPAGDGAARARCLLRVEAAEDRAWDADLSGAPIAEAAIVEGVRYVRATVRLPGRLPAGYHRLAVEVGGRHAESLVLSAPRQVYQPPRDQRGLSWGLFLPLYALQSGASLTSGDLSDLRRVTEWTLDRGGGFFATLPLLASFLDEPFDPSPYSPVSRLFWNEIFLDVDEAAGSLGLRETINVEALRRRARELRSARYVDYRAEMAVKRLCLEPLARRFFDQGGAQSPRLKSFIEGAPRAAEYARFRAVVERRGTTWEAWPRDLQEGPLPPGAFDEHAMRYHLWAQYEADRQLSAVSHAVRERGQGLYVDLPLGVHGGGFDVWQERGLFAVDAEAGAPPDDFFTLGQKWGFPPMRPERIRETGYGYVIDVLRHHLRHAGVLRLDHVMGLHRLYWVPRDLDARDGVYVRYPPEEMYAILAIESQRYRSIIVGENLGTVPREVNKALTRHGLHGLYLGQFRVSPNESRPFDPPRHHEVAALNSHDLPPFASYWRGLDIEERRDLGLLDDGGATRESAQREAVRKALVAFFKAKGLLDAETDDQAVLAAWLQALASSDASLVVVNLEDLWLETLPQNSPGVGSDRRPSWRRRARLTLAELQRSPEVLELLRLVDEGRKQRR